MDTYVRLSVSQSACFQKIQHVDWTSLSRSIFTTIFYNKALTLHSFQAMASGFFSQFVCFNLCEGTLDMAITLVKKIVGLILNHWLHASTIVINDHIVVFRIVISINYDTEIVLSIPKIISVAV